MVGEIEMYTHQGVCRYCGEIQPILAADQTDANIKISMECGCGGHEKERQHEKMIMNLEQIIGSKAGKNGFIEIIGDRRVILNSAAEAILNDIIDKITIKFSETTVTMNKNSSGNVKIQRAVQKKAVSE